MGSDGGEFPPKHPVRPDVQNLARRGADRLAEFILTLAHDASGIGNYVRAFIAGDDTGEARKILEAELAFVCNGEREYDYRHRRRDLMRQRVDHLIEAIELVVLPTDARAAFELLTRLIESDGEVAQHTGDAWLQPTFERACEAWLRAANAIPKGEVTPVLGRLRSADELGLRRRLMADGGP